ncbi:MAG: terminase [Bradyrhizobium sp.]
MADVLLYGGQGGGGKSGLLLGLGLTSHKRSLLVRRNYGDLSALTEEAIRFNGTREGFNGSPPPKLRTGDARLIEFGALHSPGSEQNWQGNPHDLFGADEACQLLEQQVRFLMGWVRTTDAGQRCRTVLASNPPLAAAGLWIVGMFRPWLDLTHPNPAKHGELRWFVTDPDGRDMEVPSAAPVEIDGHTYIPKSRTFIPARLADNPFLVNTGYQAELDALPEPVRSAVRDGNFMAARKDAEWQVIPSAWAFAAQARWQPQPPLQVLMCAMGVDVAQGGADDTVLAIRHDGWYAPCVAVPGKRTPFGKDVAGLIIANRRDNALVVIDLGGGYGGAAFEHLRSNDPDFPVKGYKGAEKATGRTADRRLKFVNMRSQAIWRFREALDPSQPGGSPIALPEDPMLIADLTAPTFEVGPNGIKVESKEDVCARLGRSTDRGDAVVMAWSGGEHGLVARAAAGGFYSAREQARGDWAMQPAGSNGRPNVMGIGHQAARKNARMGR